MTEAWLGIIAVSVLVMAVIQVAAVVLAARTARKVEGVLQRLDQDVRPIVANLQTLSADAARAVAVAAAQAERAERMLGELAGRIDQTMASLQNSVVTPAREWLGMLQGLKAAFAAFRHRDDSPRKRRAAVEEDDALFIG